MVTRATGGGRGVKRGTSKVGRGAKASPVPPVAKVEPTPVELLEPNQASDLSTEDGRRRAREAFQGEYGKLTDGDLSFQQKMDTVVRLQGSILPMMFQEAMKERPSPERAMALSKASIAIRDVAGVIQKKHEAEISEKLNPYSAEFQFTLMWLIELFSEVLKREGVVGIQANNVFSVLAVELNGFEDRILNRFKGVAARALNQVKNPFLEDFMSKVRNPNLELPMEDFPFDGQG